MEWIKIVDRSESLPEEPFMATDGKNLVIIQPSSTGFPLKTLFLSNNFLITDTTHYTLLSNIQLPLKDD